MEINTIYNGDCLELMKEIPKKYQYREAEERWGRQWEEWGVYRYDPLVHVRPLPFSGSIINVGVKKKKEDKAVANR